MKLSCSTCCIPKYDLDDALSLFASAGYKYFETFTTWTGGQLDAHKVDREKVKQILRKYWLNFLVFSRQSLPPRIILVAPRSIWETWSNM